MKTLKRILIGISILFTTIFIECENKFSCAFVPCTEVFKSIVITILHKSDSSAYILTYFKVNRVSDNKDITIADNDLTDNKGFYTIADDSEIGIFRNKDVEVEFKGLLNNNLVLQTRFTVTADCCHISLINGDFKFYL